MLKRLDTFLLVLILGLLTTNILAPSPTLAQTSAQGASPQCPSVPATFNVFSFVYWNEAGLSGPTVLTADDPRCGNTVGYQYLASVYNYPNVAGPAKGFGQLSAQSWRKLDDKSASYADLLHKFYTGVWLQNDQYASYSAKFYNGKNQAGCTGPVVTSVMTSTINVHWTGAPISGVSADNFCVHWEANVILSSTSWYTFYVLRDDGIRLRVDGETILDLWSDSAPDLQSISMFLESGTAHNIQLDYYDSGGDAVARLSLIDGTGLIGRYYDKKINSTGEPTDPVIMKRPDVPAKFDWALGSPLNVYEDYEPGLSRIGPNTFSIIWNGKIYVDRCEDITFLSRRDDGMYAVISDLNGSNQVVLVNDWLDGPPRGTPVTIYKCPAASAVYKIEVRYYDQAANAMGTFDWNYSASIESGGDPDTEE